MEQAEIVYGREVVEVRDDVVGRVRDADRGDVIHIGDRRGLAGFHARHCEIEGVVGVVAEPRQETLALRELVAGD